MSLTGALLAFEASGDGGMHIPGMEEFSPPPLLFEGTIIEMNRITLVRVVATIGLCLVLWLASRRVRLVPKRGQVIMEMLLGLVRDNIAVEVLGKQRAKQFTPLLTWMFFVILAMNITGVIPLLNIASTAVVAMPLLLALVSWVAFIYAGVQANGGMGFLKASLFPPGVPWPIYIILTPIEFLSTFILRPFTLTVRLMVNMIAGHLLLVTFFAMTNYLLLDGVMALKAVSVLSFAAGFVFTLFEVFVAALQAYIFTLLTAIYISLSVSEH